MFDAGSVLCKHEWRKRKSGAARKGLLAEANRPSTSRRQPSLKLWPDGADMLIVGAGGCAKDVLAMLEHEPVLPALAFFDDVNADAPGFLFGKYPVLRTTSQAEDHLRNNDGRFVVATGGPPIREKLQRCFESLGGQPTSIISSHAFIGNYSRISERGVIIMHGVTITNDVTIGEGTLVNMGCTLGHGAIVGDFCELSPDVFFSSSRLGNRCHLGIGVTLVPGVEIGDDVVAGVGAVITKNVPAGKVVMGVPARWAQRHQD